MVSQQLMVDVEGRPPALTTFGSAACPDRQALSRLARRPPHALVALISATCSTNFHLRGFSMVLSVPASRAAEPVVRTARKLLYTHWTRKIRSLLGRKYMQQCPRSRRSWSAMKRPHLQFAARRPPHKRQRRLRADAPNVIPRDMPCPGPLRHTGFELKPAYATTTPKVP